IRESLQRNHPPRVGFPKGAQRRLRISDKYKRVDPRVASYALRGDGLIFTTFDGGLGLSRRNALATLSASRAKRYGFWRTRSPSAGENAAMSALPETSS